MTSAEFKIDVQISFGHCDAAGIVFYPNYFRWFDRCFHTFLLKRAGGHKALCEQLGARGIGLMDATARFVSPALDGDLLQIEMRLDKWEQKRLSIAYTGHVGDRVVVKGQELRGLFLPDGDRLKAGDMTPLRAALEMRHGSDG